MKRTRCRSQLIVVMMADKFGSEALSVPLVLGRYPQFLYLPIYALPTMALEGLR